MLRSQPTVHPANREVWLQLGGSSPPTRRPTIQPSHTNYPLVSVSTARGTECSTASHVNSFNELRQPSAEIDLGYIKVALAVAPTRETESYRSTVKRGENSRNRCSGNCMCTCWYSFRPSRARRATDVFDRLDERGFHDVLHSSANDEY